MTTSNQERVTLIGVPNPLWKPVKLEKWLLTKPASSSRPQLRRLNLFCKEAGETYFGLLIPYLGLL